MPSTASPRKKKQLGTPSTYSWHIVSPLRCLPAHSFKGQIPFGRAGLELPWQSDCLRLLSKILYFLLPWFLLQQLIGREREEMDQNRARDMDTWKGGGGGMGRD